MPFYNPFESGSLTFHQSQAQSKILLIDHIKKLNLLVLVCIIYHHIGDQFQHINLGRQKHSTCGITLHCYFFHHFILSRLGIQIPGYFTSVVHPIFLRESNFQNAYAFSDYTWPLASVFPLALSVCFFFFFLNIELCTQKWAMIFIFDNISTKYKIHPFITVVG